jgi:hypothetical protein
MAERIPASQKIDGENRTISLLQLVLPHMSVEFPSGVETGVILSAI